MQPAITSIVDTYVRHANRPALLELWRIRNNLKINLETLAVSCDPSKFLAQLEDEMAIIEAGIAKLNTAAAA
jgi:hypothetical protein